MNNGVPELVLFDLDGTLVDSVPDIAYCIDQMLGELGRAPAGETQVRMWVGNGAERLIKRALTRAMDAEPDDTAEYQRAHARFLELYGEHTDELSRLYPGALEGLRYARSLGCPVGCVTNKAARFTEPLLRSLGIRGEFEIVVSGDTLARRKPDPLPLLHCADKCGARPAHSVMVGDSINDIQAARAAGFRIVCVSYGYNHGNDISVEKPDAVIPTLADLSAHL
ncbi:MAG TPA: phosphoglycolate phosphatase [Gammaproteobacteria bacterium]|nr:phosphoglycolate phosphatase [Gammaproteobacteria bacterium]